MFWRFFDRFGENTVNTDVFGASEAQNRGTYGVVLPLVENITVFAVFFGLGVAKHSYLRSFQLVARRMRSMPKARRKQCKLQCFRAWQAAKKRQTFAKKCPKSTSETHLGILASFSPARGPQKTSKHHQPEGFWGVGGRRAPPGS